jgi:hypothetical protein
MSGMKVPEATMRKVQVFLRGDQKAALRSIAARTGRKQSDLIRSGVDLLIERTERDGEGWKAATAAVAGLWSDHSEVEAANAEMRQAVKRRFASVYRKT